LFAKKSGAASNIDYRFATNQAQAVKSGFPLRHYVGTRVDSLELACGLVAIPQHGHALGQRLERERLKASLSAAEGLLLQPRGEGELIELSDDEAVAAAVMLPMVAADRMAPSVSNRGGSGALKRNVKGIV
jgi:hypothetical protein